MNSNQECNLASLNELLLQSDHSVFELQSIWIDVYSLTEIEAKSLSYKQHSIL